jgi:hypothetical protein
MSGKKNWFEANMITQNGHTAISAPTAAVAAGAILRVIKGGRPLAATWSRSTPGPLRCGDNAPRTRRRSQLGCPCQPIPGNVSHVVGCAHPAQVRLSYPHVRERLSRRPPHPISSSAHSTANPIPRSVSLVGDFRWEQDTGWGIGGFDSPLGGGASAPASLTLNGDHMDCHDCPDVHRPLQDLSVWVRIAAV